MALNEAITVVLWLDLVYKRIPEVVENFSKLELQIKGFYEPIGFPNHGTFVTHEIKIISGNFEPFWSSFEGWSVLGREKLNLTGGGLILARREVFKVLF